MRILFTSISALLGIALLSSCGMGKSIWGPSFISDRYSGIPDEMFYQTKGSCDNGDLTFQVLGGAGAILWDVPQTQSENDILTGQVFIYLNRDGTYTVNYREYTFTNVATLNEFSSTYTFDPEIQVITFRDLGSATINKRRNRYYLRLTFTTNINSRYLKGQTIDVWLDSTYNGLNTDREDYCSP